MSLFASPSKASSACNHSTLNFSASSHADAVGYRSFTVQQRATAAGKKTTDKTESGNTFPAPLVLPGDELAFSPRDPPQSFRSWLRGESRNEVSRRRNVLYVAAYPRVAAEVAFVRGWSIPQQQGEAEGTKIAQPRIGDVVKYLAAFYHSLSVKLLPPETLEFSAWDQIKKRKADDLPHLISLDTTTEKVGIRVRPSPYGIFRGQLNLNDLLDTAISILPDDAYALLMLMEHDLFEDEDDDFCCGRAYGGSRVAVVSTARYNPTLDASQNVERQHAWPASHCETYVQECCGVLSKPEKIPKKSTQQTGGATFPISPESPLEAAVAAHRTLTASDLSGLWLSRVCQTASHELGHCFGIAHCVYYACVMQSTASLAEDVRQPPYLCPIDLAKILRATGSHERQRYIALDAFCEDHKHIPMFAAFAAWLGTRLGGLNEQATASSVIEGSSEMPIEL